MAVMLRLLRIPLSWREIFKRTFYEAFWEDNCLGMSAQLAYYFFFALFPALLFLVAVASYFPVATLVDDMFRTMGGFVPAEALIIITDQLKKISENKEGGLLTFGMLLTLWSSSGAMTAIIDTLNAAYDIQEGRPWWKVRLTAIGLTVAVSIFILASFALVIVGPTFATRVAEWMHLGPVFEWTWKILQWPLIFALVSTAIAAVYYWGPDAEQEWVWLTPGAFFATTLWLLASLGFKYYVANMGNYTETYGAIGGFMVLMLWFYISGLVILIGAEMNAEIEHASPYGKDEGEKVPGEKRKIGVARMRAWVTRRLRRGDKPPSAAEVDAVIRGEAPMPAPAPAVPVMAMSAAQPRGQLPQARRFSDWLIGLGAMAAAIYYATRQTKTGSRT